MNLLLHLERLHEEWRANRWMGYFATFCRIVLALGFLPSGLVKVMGERFTALPSNHPLGHYFDALYITGYYYTFIGASQLVTALLLVIPRTAHLGALLYFPIILNICVLTYALRFEGTRIVTFMLLASLFLLVWYFDRFKPLLPVKPAPIAATGKFPLRFFALVFAALATVVVVNHYLYDIRPGNEKLECTNGCAGNRDPAACLRFCDCIYEKGSPLHACLTEYQSAAR